MSQLPKGAEEALDRLLNIGDELGSTNMIRGRQIHDEVWIIRNAVALLRAAALRCAQCGATTVEPRTKEKPLCGKCSAAWKESELAAEDFAPSAPVLQDAELPDQNRLTATAEQRIVGSSDCRESGAPSPSGAPVLLEVREPEPLGGSLRDEERSDLQWAVEVFDEKEGVWDPVEFFFSKDNADEESIDIMERDTGEDLPTRARVVRWARVSNQGARGPLDALAKAKAAYVADPVDNRDRPSSWGKLAYLLEAVDAALGETEPETETDRNYERLVEEDGRPV